MFLKNYSPRSYKLKKKKTFLVVKYGMGIFFIAIIITTYTLSKNNKNIALFEENFYTDSNSNNKNTIKIENARLIGNDINDRPYMITAKSALKNNIKTNTMFLNMVEADIPLESGKWLLLKTSKATYNIKKKILSSKELVRIFYNNGTSLEASNVKYNISSGLVKGNGGIVMYGGWGVIKAGTFLFDINKQKLKFLNNPSMQIN